MNEIAFRDISDATIVAQYLLDNDYVVMLSKEENLTILNYEYSEYGDRNNIVFKALEDYEAEQDRMCAECINEKEEETNEY